MRINTFLPNLFLRSPNLILGDNAFAENTVSFIQPPI